MYTFVMIRIIIRLLYCIHESSNADEPVKYSICRKNIKLPPVTPPMPLEALYCIERIILKLRIEMSKVVDS